MQLNEAKPVRQLEFSPEERKQLKSLGLITAKKVLYVANVDESDIHGEGPLVRKVRERAQQEAAGVIHTDFEKGFIRADVYTLDDLRQHKTEPAIKAAGRMRSEGKSYIMK